MSNRKNLKKSKFSETWMNENGIIYQMIDEKLVKINLPIAKQLVQDRIDAMGSNINIPVNVIVFSNNALKVDSDAKLFYRKKEAYQNINSIAMIMDNYLARLVATLIFLTNPNPHVEIKLFNNETSALKWLETRNQKNLN